jgi:hypothetical protein
MDRESALEEFVEEVWDAVCRLCVGSGLTTEEVVRALKRVEELVQLGSGAESLDLSED